jgi:hypothetical protein
LGYFQAVRAPRARNNFVVSIIRRVLLPGLETKKAHEFVRAPSVIKPERFAFLFVSSSTAGQT